jgi:ABC-type sugar transport system permease subunit
VLFSPLFYGFWFSLFQIQYGSPTNFIGLGNYERLLADRHLAGTASKTLIFTLATVLLTLTISLALAVWIDKLGKRFGSAVQLVVILPWIISAVVATLLFRWVFVNDIGLASAITRQFGFGEVALLNSPNSAMGLLIAVSVWKRIGYAVILLLAGLKAIPEDYSEAARIDGASNWQIFWYVTLPLLRTPLLLVSIVLTLSNLNTVETPMVMTGGGPGDATRIIPMEIYQRAFINYDLGSATSLALLVFGFNILLVILYMRAARWKV